MGPMAQGFCVAYKLHVHTIGKISRISRGGIDACTTKIVVRNCGHKLQRRSYESLGYVS
jgi:hypothetical protein